MNKHFRYLIDQKYSINIIYRDMKLNLFSHFSTNGEHNNTSLTVESLQKAFLMIDVNGDGFLSRTEIDEFLSILGDTPSESTKGKIHNMISDPQRGELVDKFVFQVRIELENTQIRYTIVASNVLDMLFNFVDLGL